MLPDTMPFFDAHCDTITKIWEHQADFAAEGGGAGYEGAAGRDAAEGAPGSTGAHGGRAAPGSRLHVTLPGLRAAGVCAQVFASWVWTEKHRGRELDVGLEKVEAVRRLCEDYPDDLFFARTGTEVAEACRRAASESQAASDAFAELGAYAEPGAHAGPGAYAEPGAHVAPTAVIAGLEGADPLQGDVDNLALFHRAGVRLLTPAWHDNAFLGSTFGGNGGLTVKGADLVAACEEQRVLVDVSHASDQAFADICRVATRPFVASHSNCRSLCPAGRNLTDGMIRAIAERGGVIGMTLAPGFLSADYYRKTRGPNEEFWRSIADGTATVQEAGKKCAAAEALIPRPPLRLIVDHVRHAMNLGGEDAVGLGGDLDGVDMLPAGLEGVADYPRIAELLVEAGLTSAQVDKVCYGNFARVFKEVLG
jgi:membrane dipeptidase